MRQRRAGRTACGALLTLALVATLGAAAPQRPDEHTTPTTEELRSAVQLYTLRGSVEVADLAQSVTGLQTITTTGSGTVITLKSDILFDFASAELSPVAAARIGQLVGAVPRNARVTVTGYTDAVGSDSTNRLLSQRRAEAVGGAVTARRPDLALQVTGRGEAEPVAPNTVGGKDNPEGRAKNRRVEIRYGR